MCRSVDCHCARQRKERSPDCLCHQRCGGNVKTICGCNFLEKQSVVRHCVVHAGAGENQSVIATERGNHDRCSHAHRTWLTEHCFHHCHGHAVVRRMLDFRKRQNGEISDVCKQIKDDDDSAASYERAHKIFSRVAHFAPNKRYICPRRLRKKRTNHRSSKEQCES